MTNEEAKVFLDNLKICINEHPIVADWLVEIADRKTENCSEIPNNCEDEQIEKCPFDDPIPCEWVCTEWNHCKYKPKDEPQTSGTPYKIETSSVCKDEPQTERSSE